MSEYTNHMNNPRPARSQYPPGLGPQSFPRPAYVCPLPESQQYGSIGFDPRSSGGEFYNRPPPDPAQHSSGKESCFDDHRQSYSDSGPPPDSPQQIPAISEYSGFDGVKFQPPNSTRTNMSGSERPFPSHQNIINRSEDRASSHEKASSNLRESSSAHRQLHLTCARHGTVWRHLILSRQSRAVWTSSGPPQHVCASRNRTR